MKVTSKYSHIIVISTQSEYRGTLPIIQIEKVEDYLFLEVLDDINGYRNETKPQTVSLSEQNKAEQLENEYNDALEIVLNNDPQGKWSGCTLAEILSKDVEWFKWAKANMRNPYIKKFVCVICEHDNIK